MSDSPSQVSSSKGAAIVTGAAGGIGRAIALRLAQDGFELVLNDLAPSLEVLETLAGEITAVTARKVIVVTGDVGNEEDVTNLINKTVEEFSSLAVMVANAGIANPLGHVVDTSLKTWERYLHVNLTGVFLCYRAAAQQMLKQGGGGRIIGASSAYGKQGYARAAAYSTTKFGVRGLTQSLAAELAKTGITVNAYAPGYIDTPLLYKFVVEKDYNVPSEPMEPDAVVASINGMKHTTPMQKLGKPQDVAALVSYMVSDEANFMTGQCVSLNGGLYYD